LKVLHITEALGGGVASYLIDLTRAQLNFGIKPTVIYLDRNVGNGIKTHALGFDSRVRLVRVNRSTTSLASFTKFVTSTSRLLKSENFDVIHIHSSIAGALMSIFLEKAERSKALYSPHAWAFSRKDVNWAWKLIYKAIEKILVTRTAGVITVSEAEYLQGKALNQSAKIWKVDNGVPLPVIGKKKRKKPGEPIRVVSIGRLCPQKDPERFGFLASAIYGQDVSFEWIGGYLNGDDKKYNYDLGRASVTGWVSRELVNEKLANSDIFVLLSAWEGMPIALIEAQTLGLPSIVSPAEGNSEIVADGVTGFVVRSNQEALEKLILLLTNLKMRERFNVSALSQRERWSILRVESEVRSIYLKVTSQKALNA
jgi:glycosyltransferase involved in cell wall biosynthesis